MLLGTLAIAAAVVLLNLRDDAPQVNDSARVLALDLLFARSEAVRLGQTLSLSFASDGLEYQLSLRGEDDGETPLLRREVVRLYPLVEVMPVVASGDAVVHFGPNGQAEGALFAFRSVQDERFSRCIRLESSGRVSFEADCPPGLGELLLAAQ